MNKILVKSKIVLSADGRCLITYFWKRTFLCFGYWYPFGGSSGSKQSDKKVSKINDESVSNVLYDNFITGL